MLRLADGITDAEATFSEYVIPPLETAKKLYRNRLRPHLMAEHDVSDDDLERARRGEQLDRALADRVRSRFVIT